jgi:hypothetical protein
MRNFEFMFHFKNSRFSPVRAACPLYSGVIVSLGTESSISEAAADFLSCAQLLQEKSWKNFRFFPLHSTACSFLHGKAEKERLPSETIQRSLSSFLAARLEYSTAHTYPSLALSLHELSNC